MKKASVVLVFAFMVSCSGGASTDTRASTDYVIQQLHASHDAGARLRPFNSITELLGNTVYKRGDEAARPLTEAVVVGQIIDVDPGWGFRIEGRDAPSGIETDFDDSRAIWKTLHVRMKLESVISGETNQKEPMIGFAFDASVAYDQAREGLLSLGRVLLFLNKSPVFDYDPELYGTVEDGGLVGKVDDDDRISLPTLSDFEESKLLRNASTLQELRRAAAEPKEEIKLDESGARASS